MGTAAFGSGILEGLDVPGAIDLLTGYLDHLGDYPKSVAGLAPGEQLEVLLMLAAGDGVLMTWDAARDQLSIEVADDDGCAGVARALALAAVCLPGPAAITMLGEAGRTWRYVLVDGDVSLRPAVMNFDGPVLGLNLSAFVCCSHCGQAIAQADDGGWRDAPNERSWTMAGNDEIDAEALFEELEAEADALLAKEGGEGNGGHACLLGVHDRPVAPEAQFVEPVPFHDPAIRKSRVAAAALPARMPPGPDQRLLHGLHLLPMAEA